MLARCACPAVSHRRRARESEQATVAATVRVDAPAGLYLDFGDVAGLALSAALGVLGVVVRRAPSPPV